MALSKHTYTEFVDNDMENKSFEVEGFSGNGSYKELVTIFYHKGWYIVEGSTMAHYTSYPIYTGVDVEVLEDIDVCNSPEPIESLEELIDLIDN